MTGRWSVDDRPFWVDGSADDSDNYSMILLILPMMIPMIVSMMIPMIISMTTACRRVVV